MSFMSSCRSYYCSLSLGRRRSTKIGYCSASDLSATSDASTTSGQSRSRRVSAKKRRSGLLLAPKGRRVSSHVLPRPSAEPRLSSSAPRIPDPKPAGFSSFSSLMFNEPTRTTEVTAATPMVGSEDLNLSSTKASTSKPRERTETRTPKTYGSTLHSKLRFGVRMRWTRQPRSGTMPQTPFSFTRLRRSRARHTNVLRTTRNGSQMRSTSTGPWTPRASQPRRFPPIRDHGSSGNTRPPASVLYARDGAPASDPGDRRRSPAIVSVPRALTRQNRRVQSMSRSAESQQLLVAGSVVSKSAMWGCSLYGSTAQQERPISSSNSTVSSVSSGREKPGFLGGNSGIGTHGYDLLERKAFCANAMKCSPKPLFSTIGDSAQLEADGLGDETQDKEAAAAALPPGLGTISIAPVSHSVPTHFTREQTLILLDWDDTLLPSSWLAARSLRVDSIEHMTHEDWSRLEAIAAQGCALLTQASQLGRVVVVTNAEAGWVQLSGTTFLPSLLEAVQRHNVSVISARSHFETAQCKHPVQWKTEAFQKLLHMAFPLVGSKKNVLSFGDSESERVAVIRCVKSLLKQVKREQDTPEILYKSFKLWDHPTPKILHQQLTLLQKLLPQIAQHPGNLDLRIKFVLKGASSGRQGAATATPLNSLCS